MSNSIIFDGIDNVTRFDFENYQISAQDTVGVEDDDIVYHILVLISDSFSATFIAASYVIWR